MFTTSFERTTRDSDQGCCPCGVCSVCNCYLRQQGNQETETKNLDPTLPHALDRRGTNKKLDNE